MSAGNRVIVIGELNIDLVAGGLSQEPKMGTEIVVSDFRLTLGSASAIFACGIAKLGHQVTFIAKVGWDYFGEFCVKALRDAGVSARHVMRDESLKTGVTISLSTPKDRALITYPGAIAGLGPEHVRRSWFLRHNHLHMTSYFLQTRLQRSFARIFREAQEMGLSTSFDPNSDPAHAWSDNIRKVFAHTDVLFLNETEALKLTSKSNARDALKTLSTDVPCVVIKLGPRGALAAKSGEITSASGFKVKATDTTGAGDSFAAGFISSYLRGHSLKNCLYAGNACGALSTLQAGGTAGQPTRQALTRFLRAHRRKERLS